MIYTFYSYKGGVGRSMALANVAEMLYTEGLKVLMIDFDLEAPGLEQYFYRKEDPTLQEALRTRGVIDLLLSYKNLRSLPPVNLPPDDHTDTATAPDLTAEPQDTTSRSDVDGGNENSFPYPVEPLTNFMLHIYPKNANGGQLSLIPAGSRAGQERSVEAGASGGAAPTDDKASASNAGTDNKDTTENAGSGHKPKDEFTLYAERVRAFAWDDFYINWDGELFFDWFREKAADFADVVLIDSRTGVAEMSGVCTYQLADAVVMFVAPNNQNVYGTRKVARSLVKPDLVSQGRKGRELSLMLVPTRVDVSSEKFFLDEFATRFRAVADVLNSEKLTFENDPFDLRIPYVSYYSFVDEIAAQDPSSPVAVELVKAYEKICVKLAQLEPVDSKLRAKFEAKTTDEPVTAERQNKTAERAYLRLKPEAQARAPRIFKRLVRLSQRGENSRDTPLRVSVEEFNTIASKEEIQELTDVGLLIIETDTGTEGDLIGFSDESLVQSWRRLRAWLEADRDFLLWRQSLKTNLNEWKTSGDKSALLGGSVLARAEAWSEERIDELNLDEFVYLTKSSDYQKKQRIAKYVRAAVALLLVLLVAFVIWQYEKRKKQQEQLATQEIQKNREAAAKSYYANGNIALEKGDLDSALAAYTQAIDKLPEFAEAYLNRGKVYVLRSDHDNAQRDFDQAIKLKPNYAEAYASRGSFYLAFGKLDEAQSDLNQAIILRPDYPEAFYYRGELYARREDRVASIQDYTRAISLKADYGDAYYWRAFGYIQQRDDDRAVADLRNAIQFATSPGRQTDARRVLEISVGRQKAQEIAPIAPASPPRVSIHYNDPNDADRIKALEQALSAAYDVQGIDVGSAPTQGEVRYYYSEDGENANRIRTVVSKSLADNKINLNVHLVLVSNVYRSIHRGSIEVWMPPLSAKPGQRGSATQR